jgi:hypothetical protein
MVSDTVRPDKEKNSDAAPKKRSSLPVYMDTKNRLANRGMKGTTWDRLLNDIMDRCDALEVENKELKATIRGIKNE